LAPISIIDGGANELVEKVANVVVIQVPELN
jgi:hypothetical protein